MLRIYTASAVPPVVYDTMHKDRTTQFRDRMGWPVDVNEHGHERDQYDLPHALYIVEVCDEGTHKGSMRLLPTDGPHMASEHFLEAMGGFSIRDRSVWESSRFCLSPRFRAADNMRTSARLMLMAYEFGRVYGLRALLAVFDRQMLRVYAKQGCSPVCLSDCDPCAGLWYRDNRNIERTYKAVGIDRETIKAEYAASNMTKDFDHDGRT